ncbi:hypothetical protein NPIL_74731 [Nephila pilipes]|uniref:Uncharacterized protein n=1 Tax=Nephila pilipes TaxID=299642 RepID=A0A8X6NNK1_NEPPI|nr:hypothetical protein NPIL_74731 [Nephila pilipes]
MLFSSPKQNKQVFLRDPSYLPSLPLIVARKQAATGRTGVGVYERKLRSGHFVRTAGSSLEIRRMPPTMESQTQLLLMAAATVKAAHPLCSIPFRPPPTLRRR